MNGLVYFDQFSLIPPVHLGLVILGIFVLLGGVWVVSIHSGGGGIDVGTWNEGDGFSCQESILLPDSEVLGDTQEVATISMTKQPISNHRPVGRTETVERGTLSESSIPNIAISSQSAGLELSDPAQDSSLASIPTTEIHRSLAPQVSSSSPEVPSQRSSARRVLARQSSTSMHSGNLRSVSQPQSQTTTLGPVSSLGAGFQIGLSPSSPGFTILPRERRRRISGFGAAGRPSLADVANDIIIDLRESERRRTASEGGELTRTLLNDDQDVSRDDGAAAREDHAERIGEGGTDETSDQLEARERWRWIRKVFIGKD